MNSLITVEEYDKSHLAQVAVLALEQAGIRCYLQNETVVSMDWFMANAVGGIRLQVASQDAAKAQCVLAEIRANRIEREESRKDTWVAFRCVRCKKLVAFSGLSLGRVECCPKCGKHVDVPEQSDPSLSEDDNQEIIEQASRSSKFYSGALSSRTYLVLEIFFILCIFYLFRILHSIQTFIESSTNGTKYVYQIEELSNWLVLRSVVVLTLMAPILFLNGLSHEPQKTRARSWANSAVIGLLLGGICGLFVYGLSYLVNEPYFVQMAEWPGPVRLGFLKAFSWYIWFAFALVANSAAEELVAIGYMIDRLEKLFGKTWIAVLVSAVLFGSYHFHQGMMIGFVCATLTGIVFGWYFARTRKLFPLIAAHSIYSLIYFAFSLPNESL